MYRLTTTYTVTSVITYTLGFTDCYASTTITQSVSPCAGIENKEGVTFNISIFPNPSEGNITVVLENASENSFIEINNAIGHLFYEQKIESKEVLINKEFSSGTYLVKIMEGNSVLFRKKILIIDK